MNKFQRLSRKKNSVNLPSSSQDDTPVDSSNLDNICSQCREGLSRPFGSKFSHHQSLENFNAAISSDCALCNFALWSIHRQNKIALSPQEFKPCLRFPIQSKRTDNRFSLNGAYDDPEVSGSIKVWSVVFEIYVLKTFPPKQERMFSEMDHSSTKSLGVSQWLDACIKTHSCWTDHVKLYIPPRLLDCSMTTKIRLVEAMQVLERDGDRRYATLSHRWGVTPKHAVLTTDNIHEFYKGVSYDLLPLTFKDAVEVIRRLGIRYLWIDSLCIIQEGWRQTSDWQRHITAMADVYSNCYINIAAAHSVDSQGGCFINLPRAFPGACFTRLEGWGNSKGMVKVGIVAGGYGQVRDSPLNTRAWVFQERLLSPRIIHYEETDIFWECRELYASANFPAGMDHLCPGQNHNYPRPFRYNGKGMHVYLNVVENGVQAAFHRHHWKPYLPALSSTSSTSTEYWTVLVRSYNGLHLSYAEDRLPGIAAIALRMNQKYFHDRYVAGFFKSQLPEALYFQRYGDFKPPAKYVAPSWSWASAPGTIIFSGTKARKGRETFNKVIFGFEPAGKVISKVKDLTVELEDPQNEYGRIKSGSVTIQAPVSRHKFDSCWMLANTGLGDTCFNLNQAGRSSMWGFGDGFSLFFDDRRSAITDELLTFLPIWLDCGIVLVDNNDPNQHPAYRRVGWWSARGDFKSRGQEYWKSVDQELLVIV